MSKTADKTATRPAFKQNAFNPRSGPFLPKAAPQKTSWWLVGAAPSDRDQFIAAAHQRALEAWTNVAAHAMSPRGEFA